MSAHSQHVHAPEHEDEHVHGGPKLYLIVLGCLLVLTGITVAVSYFPTSSQFTNIMIAMTIATAKASLVGLIFMHLRWDKPLNSVIFVSGVFFLGILLTYTLIDSFSRPVLYPTQTTDRFASKKAPEGVPPPIAGAAPGQAMPSQVGAPPAGEAAPPPPAGEAAHPPPAQH